MNFYTELFSSKLGFDFNENLKSKELYFENNEDLNSRLKSKVFFFNNQNNTSTSFYLIATVLNSNEIEIIRKYIWNKNDADLIFYYPNKDSKLVMFYAKYSPNIGYKESTLDEFNPKGKDLKEIEKIKHWQFDSGAFWLNYHSYIDKTKYKGIDKELISTLKSLKEELSSKLTPLIIDNDSRSETVQALIDRTLYIKYLEDNHIINSTFYNLYFENNSLSYKQLLENGKQEEINLLFKLIHEIFNNNLFDQPTIKSEYLTQEICNLIAQSFSADLKTRQLRLYDFQFDILPVEFISYIYEVFLSEKQKDNGIYYTPKKLAQLIVDDVITENEIGSVLDPSSGSGMFLIVAFHKLLEIAKRIGIEPKNNIDKIKFRTKLLSENIFGIEKQLTAQRFTFFSLSLQIFNGINPSDIKEYIANELEKNKKIDLFNQHSFFENIKCANTLSTNEEEVPFKGKKFKYIVGNPPFFEIPNTSEFDKEIIFLNNYKIKIENNFVKAKDIVGKHQISQCFFLKIKDWSDNLTRFGFVSNSSNFYNDNSIDFQKYFFSNYKIEKVYELSRVKKILFEKAKESVVSIIFSNDINNNNKIEYFPVDLGLFSEKPFELLIIQEDKQIKIDQKDFIAQKITLRDFLVGNEYDIAIFNKLNKLNNLKDIVLESNDSVRGIQVWGDEAAKKEYSIDINEWKKLKKDEKEKLKTSFINKYFSKIKNATHKYEFYKPNKIQNFTLLQPDLFFNDKSNFDKIRTESIFEGEKILWNRIGKIKAVYSIDTIYYDFDIYSFRLKDKNLYYLITAVLNSNIINFYVTNFLRKRVDSSFPKIGQKDLLNLPIPNELNHELITQISNLSKEITKKKYKYTEKEKELNELIFDLYDLSFIEKQRVRDFFLSKEKIGRKKTLLDNYQLALIDTIEFYLNNPVKIEFTSTDFNLIVAKISLNKNNTDKSTPEIEKTKKYILNEIFEQNPNENFLASQEKIFGKDCVYIIKQNLNIKWSETKAFEDGQEIIKYLIPNSNGERIY